MRVERCIAQVVDLDLLHLQPPVVGAVVHGDHVEPALDQLDRRQESLALQPAGIELVRVIVGRHDELHAAVHHLLEEAAENHRVGDVRNMEFIEADQSIPPCRARRCLGNRVLRPFQGVEFAMDLAHEMVEMHPALPDQWHTQVERVHQEALAASDRAPEVHALRQRRLDEQALQRARAALLIGAPFFVQPLQALDRAPLRRIGDEAAAREALLVDEATSWLKC